MRRGFTLIELLVVIVIIGILATISVAAFSGYQEKARLAKAQAFATQVFKKFKLQSLENGQNAHSFYLPYENDSISTTTQPYVTDWSGNENHLTVRHSLGTYSQSTDTPNGSGGSIRINNRYLAVPTGLNYEPTDNVTMATWVKMEEMPLIQTFPLFLNGSAALRISADGSALFNVNHNTIVSSVISDAGVIVPGQWHYLVGSYDNSTETIRFWIDGDLIGEKNLALYRSFGGVGLYIGYYDTGSYVFNGWLDDSQIFPFAYTGD